MKDFKKTISEEFVAFMGSAAQTGEINVCDIEYYAAMGADINYQGMFNESVLHTAAGLDYTDTDIIDALIMAGADVNLKSKEGKQTPLHYAAQKSTYSVMKALIDAGADINAKDAEGNTPLMYLAKRSWMENIEWMIDDGADPAIKNKRGKTAFDLYKKTCKDDTKWFEETTNNYI